MTLESSETEFAATYAPYAAEGVLYPGREGSPLLEFAAGGRVLYLFDRSGPYAARPGPARFIIHGLLDPDGTQLLTEHEEPAERLDVVGVSAVAGQGVLLQVGRLNWVVRARVPLVLGSFIPLPPAQPGDWVAFRTLPPLHGFLPPLP
ncbi:MULTISPECIES: hypothetical protein [Deinococcus]|uniref:hypothetical protein n=1 Tax=Deinococcus TaxID=1298 RepID=UPI00048845A8|nr:MULTISPECIES: hypothetical protein [Deinococcus]KEF34093.1 hypothetical protein RDMS_08975 [Deinococcus sp. RL]